MALLLQARGGLPMEREEAAILQLNIGLYCNQACSHCHVESSPKRTEMMDRATAEQCVRLMQANSKALTTVDITGGAPELNSQFKWVYSQPTLFTQWDFTCLPCACFNCTHFVRGQWSSSTTRYCGVSQHLC